MADTSREPIEQVPQRQIKTAAKLFFLNGRLVKVLKADKSANIAYLYDYLDDKHQTMLYSDFRKHRKRAYNVEEVRRIFNKSHTQFYRYITLGYVQPPKAATPGGIRKWMHNSYFSEEDLFELRDSLSRTPRKRKVLTEAELRARLGETLMLYTLNADGQFVPVWSEDTY